MLADPQPTTREAPASAADMSDPRGDPSTGVADPAPRDAHPRRRRDRGRERSRRRRGEDPPSHRRRRRRARRSLIPDGAFDADPLDVLDALAAVRAAGPHAARHAPALFRLASASPDDSPRRDPDVVAGAILTLVDIDPAGTSQWRACILHVAGLNSVDAGADVPHPPATATATVFDREDDGATWASDVASRIATENPNILLDLPIVAEAIFRAATTREGDVSVDEQRSASWAAAVETACRCARGFPEEDEEDATRDDANTEAGAEAGAEARSLARRVVDDILAPALSRAGPDATFARGGAARVLSSVPGTHLARHVAALETATRDPSAWIREAAAVAFARVPADALEVSPEPEPATNAATTTEPRAESTRDVSSSANASSFADRTPAGPTPFEKATRAVAVTERLDALAALLSDDCGEVRLAATRAVGARRAAARAISRRSCRTSARRTRRFARRPSPRSRTFGRRTRGVGRRSRRRTRDDTRTATERRRSSRPRNRTSATRRRRRWRRIRGRRPRERRVDRDSSRGGARFETFGAEDARNARRTRRDDADGGSRGAVAFGRRRGRSRGVLRADGSSPRGGDVARRRSDGTHERRRRGRGERRGDRRVDAPRVL